MIITKKNILPTADESQNPVQVATLSTRYHPVVRSFSTARKTIIGYETMNQIRKGQTSWNSKRKYFSSSRIRVSIFWSRCIIPTTSLEESVLSNFLQHNPNGNKF